MTTSKHFVRQGNAVYALKARAYEKLLVSLAKGHPLPLQGLGTLVQVTEDLEALSAQKARHRLLEYRAKDPKRTTGRFPDRESLVTHIWALNFLSRLSDNAIADDAQVPLKTVRDILDSHEGRPEDGPFLEPQKARRFRNR